MGLLRSATELPFVLFWHPRDLFLSLGKPAHHAALKRRPEARSDSGLFQDVVRPVVARIESAIVAV